MKHKNKLDGFDPKFITNNFFPGMDPSKINRGQCFQWAYLAFRIFKDVELWDMGTHAFVKYRGKFYDSERPEGVKDYRDLPATNFGKGCGCARCIAPPRNQTVDNFKWSWRGMCEMFNLTWNELDEQADRIINQKEGGA